MKKIIIGLLGTFTLLFLGYGVVSAQSLPTIGGAMTTSTIAQPYLQSQCVEPDSSIVYVTRQFYFGDTYTTTDVVPKWGNGYDTLLLSASKVYMYNASLFSFSSAITWKSNGIPNSAPVSSIVSAQGTFVVSSKSGGQLVYNIHRTALENAGSHSYSLSYLGRPNLTNYTASLTKKTFHNQAGRVVNGFECVNYIVHYCGDGVKDTKQSIANLPGGFTNSIANEQCDGTAGVPAGYTCTSSCTLQANPSAPTCSLTANTLSITSGQMATLYGSYTNAVVATFVPTIGGITFLYPNRSNNNISVAPIVTTTYTLIVTGAAGTTPVSCPVTITVTNVPNPTCSLTTTTPTITNGQTATLNGSYTNAVVASFVPTIGGITFLYPNRSNSSISVTPTTTTTYTLIVTGAAGTTPVSCPVTITVNQPMYALTLDKTLIKNVLYRSGDLVSFKIDFANVGSATVNNALLTDYLPKGLTYVSSQLYGVNPPYNFTTGIFQGHEFVKYTGFTLTPGQQGYMIITGSFRGYQWSQDTWNRVYLDSDETNEILDSALFYVYKPTGNATVTKTADKVSYYPGEDVKFTISVTNNGPDAIDNVQLIDTWPAGTCLTLDSSFVSSIPTPPMTNSINPYTWNFNTTMTINQIAYLYLTGHIKNDPSCVGNYTNIVDLKYMVDGELKTGQAQTTINVLAVPASTMTIEKKIVQYGNNVGDPIVFELVYKNNGTATITSYDIVDYRPGTLNFVSASPMPTTQTITSGGALLRWIFTSPLAPNGGGKITLNGTIK